MTATDAMVRVAYAARADEYVGLLGSVAAMPVEDERRISTWAASVEGRILDAGCGPGHWTNHLRDLGHAVEGIDLVDAFVSSARRRFPGLVFRQGDLRALPVEDAALGGILAWYSLIHADPADMPAILSEFARALRPGGSLLVGFFDGGAIEPFPHKVVTAYRWSVPEMRCALADAGFDATDVERRADPGARPHAAITARRRAD